ncbi:MAG: Holliday junction branch migration protein RuvA [Clostridia bacterium]|nr:Holliday junction branch migration protein RuvA [Clostridia bacterium]
MIAYLRGRVITTTAETAVLDVHGVGYELYCTAAAFSKIAQSETAELYTYLQLKEDGATLYGFATPKEKDLFLQLISVSGVGPKLAVSILMGLSADALAEAIATADVKRLSTVKGLGKKTAEKIILELHGKISAAEIMSVSEEPVAAKAQEQKLMPEDEDAVSALMGLGFTRNESVHAVKRARESGARTVEEIIMIGLRGA